jgi:3'-phosphoadenosine 5'-phosphosulfate sulfotransferase (PAPS reductase)/FAD synthetase
VDGKEGDELNQLEIVAAKAHMRRGVYLQKVEQARQIIADGLAACSTPYVAMSFGKDSAAMLHLVQQVRPSVEARFIRWTESQYLDDFDRVIAEWRQRGINLHILDMHRGSIDERGGERWSKLQQMSPADGFFVGLRAQENQKSRGMTLKVHGTVYKLASGLWRICPLAWWSTDDVAAYTIQHDLPMLDAYKADGFEQRTSARVPRATVRGEALHSLKVRDPLRFYALCQAYPEVTEWL